MQPIDVLNNYCQKINDALVKSLYDNDRAVGLGLAQSIDAKVRVFATEMVIEVHMAKYWKFVDSGVDGWEKKHGSPFSFKKAGKGIPVDAMRKLIANRGERFSPIWRSLQKFTKDKTGKLIPRKKPISKSNAQKSLAFMVGKNIKRKGFKATNFVEEAFDTGILDNLAKDLSVSLGREITLGLTFNT